MRSWVAQLLACPDCGASPLAIARADVRRAVAVTGGTETLLETGVLGCAGCRRRFPVLDESPRLVPEADLLPAERALLDHPPAVPSSGGMAIQRTDRDIAAMIESAILADYGNPPGGPGLRRARADIAYQERYADNRVYQMSWLRRQLGRDPRLILDLGGGRGGNLEAARRAMPFEHGLVVDRNPRWPPLFQHGDRSIAYVRGDATHLPLRDNSVDLVISSFLLEHVKAWEAVLTGIARTGRVAFVAFGPNRAWPWETGHIGAPLAHCLPPRMGAGAAFLWRRMTGDHRGYRRYREILGEMNYITSHRYYAACRRAGLRTQSAFGDILTAWAGSGTGRVRRAAGRHPSIVHGAATLLQAMGMEPNVYCVIRRDRPVDAGH